MIRHSEAETNDRYRIEDIVVQVENRQGAAQTAHRFQAGVRHPTLGEEGSRPHRQQVNGGGNEKRQDCSEGNRKDGTTVEGRGRRRIEEDDHRQGGGNTVQAEIQGSGCTINDGQTQQGRGRHPQEGQGGGKGEGCDQGSGENEGCAEIDGPGQDRPQVHRFEGCERSGGRRSGGPR